MAERKKFRAWITKYALTAGIQCIWAEDCFDISDRMIAQITYADGWQSHYHKPYWHLTREEAEAHADKLRVAKIKALRKQIAKLEDLSFGETTP